MLSATDLSKAVRGGNFDPAFAVADALARISLAGNALGAFRHVRMKEALAEARALRERADLAELPLAGVPIAVKDVTAVAGESAWEGYAGQQPQPFRSDSDIVARLRAAGAVIVGLTRTPQLCLWPTTDSADAIVRNPWAPTFTAGGSSGGSAAAVAAGVVPIAHGTDAFGSVCSPAAICGLVGVTPGHGTVPAADSSHWSGMYTHGPLATTVSDAALLLSVLARRTDLSSIRDPGRLRVAVSTQSPTGGRLPMQFTAAVERSAESLATAGHRVEAATPRYGQLVPAMLVRWLAGPQPPMERAARRGLEARTRTHLWWSAIVRRLGLVRQGTRRAWIARAEHFFADHDVLITPALATLPPAAERWTDRSWLTNVRPALALTPFLGPWRLAGFPTMTVPVGRHPSGLPIGAQLVGPPGSEHRLLSLAAQLEERNPWPRNVIDDALQSPPAAPARTTRA